MNGFDSAMDEPFQLIYEEVMHRFPDCKFVLTESDPERWYTSYWELNHAPPRAPNKTHHKVDKDMQSSEYWASGVGFKCENAHYWGCDFKGNQTPELKERCLA